MVHTEPSLQIPRDFEGEKSKLLLLRKQTNFIPQVLGKPPMILNGPMELE
jgi:hypothetical protein